MGILEFLELVLPSDGNRVISLGRPTSDGGVWFDNRGFATNEEAAQAAQTFDEQGETVYFAINSFGPEYEEEVVDKKGNTVIKKRIRTKVNVVLCRSLFDDFDVDVGKPAAYDTREEAFDAVKLFFKAVKLTPTIVSSGGGFHSYIHLDEDVDVDVWQELSSLKRDITTHLKIKADRSVDMDTSRILRPVGTHNRKTGTPRPVELLKKGKTYPVEFVRERLLAYVRENNVEPAPVSRKHTNMENPWAALTGDYPDSYAEDVADKCNAIRRFKESGGEDEPHWHKSIGVLKHCVDGEEKIHEWSSKYEGYSQAETQEKIDAWSTGPTTCIEMDRHVECRADCPFAEKCNSPITLGFREDAESVAEETAPPIQTTATTQGATIEGQHIPYWPQSGYRWNGSSLSKSMIDADGVVHWQPFCRSFVYPINRIRDSEGTWVIHWRAKEKNGAWREFFMPTLELASTDQMAKTFASNEVFLMRTKNARAHMAEFAEGLIEKLQEWRIETATIKQFGWTEDRSGFVLGTKMITKDGEEEVLCDPNMPSDITSDFGTKGTLDEWVRNIDLMYNRKGAEPYQFALCHSMGSALVELMGSSNWHGLPLAFTGHGGTGKTTACKIACGFYGKPKYMNRQTGEQGSTLGAAIARIAIMGALPMLMDEFSGRSSEELTRTAYALANGRDKERLNGKGGFATTGNEWFKNSFITSNDGLSETISKLPAGYKVEATQLRFFEVSLPNEYLQTYFGDIEQGFAENHMDNVYGEACRPFLRFIIKNQDWVRRQIVAARSKFNPKSNDDNKERFHRDTIVTALVAGKIAAKLGLISFDLANMKKWAIDQVLLMRESRRETNIDISEHLASFIATLPGYLIITKHFYDGRAKMKEKPLEILRGPAVGRVCTEDKKVYITVKAVSDWCKNNNVKLSDMRDELDRGGYLVLRSDGESSPKITLGSGSTIPSGQPRCYELKYHKLFDGKSLALVEKGSGVVTETQLDGTT